MNDAASAMTIAAADLAAAEGLTPIVEIPGWTSRGTHPRDTGLAAIATIRKLLERTGRTADDIAWREIDEAFALVPLAAYRKLAIDEDAVNICGSGCSIGHPISASGGRMISTLINDLKRHGGVLGVAAMCAGGGQGGTALIEV